MYFLRRNDFDSGALQRASGRAWLRSPTLETHASDHIAIGNHLCPCATDPYGSGPSAAKRTIYGASAGAAIGALAGTAAGDPFSGAAVGAVAGGAIGALMPSSVFHGRQYYGDTRGYCYKLPLAERLR
jgi:hypothetical protein